MKENVKGKNNPKKKTRWRLKLEKKGNFEEEDDEKGEFGKEGDDERHNTTNDDNCEVEHLRFKGRLRK